MMNKGQTSSQIMELKDLISAPLVATIDADSISSRRYLSYVLEFAFEDYDPQTGTVGDIRYLEFSYQNATIEGTKTQTIKIPVLTLIPLPLLQVKEACFDFDIQIIDAVSTDENATFCMRRTGQSDTEDTQDKGDEGLKLRVVMAPATTTNSKKSFSSRSLNANMKVNVKMQQADMPGGLMKFLNLAANNLVVEDSTTESETK